MNEGNDNLTRMARPITSDVFVKRTDLLRYASWGVKESRELLPREARVGELLLESPHPNLVRYYRALIQTGGELGLYGKMVKLGDEKLTFLTGLCFKRYEASLYDAIEVRGEKPDGARTLEALQAGMEYLHRLGIVHCDIHLFDIFVEKDGNYLKNFDISFPTGQRMDAQKSARRDWCRSGSRSALTPGTVGIL
ncbi:hypothetical protein BCR34DRAFT_571084 [Clohesyomyces aquaticus]|uniref:Protein kinase domain-containing protein n=1 Tax=Clohesyomyces aquaticus TaxID=1231657 RepID=A0A1Y1Z914_9PLEO|nr:hypothetical protein BCR34DRAFT_571084 [Clohesyomyces aquaticus]